MTDVSSEQDLPQTPSPSPLRRWLPDPDDDGHVTWIRRAAWVVLVAAALAFIAEGANRPADPLPVPEVGAVDRTPLEGFAQIAFRIQQGDGTAADWCALLAESPAAMQQGLRGQVGLGGYDGMIFRFPAAAQHQFTMRGVAVPLEIAFFAPDGTFVSATAMEPCPADADCPTYSAPAPFTTALETFTGGIAGLGIGPGSVLVFAGGGCGT